MAVPSSGQLRLYADIGTELGVAQSNVSLGTMSNTAGFPAPDAMSDFYGYSSQTAPSVTTNNISNIGETTLTINGNITSDGAAAITERGFYFGTNSSSPTNNTKYTVSGTTGYYSNNRTGLSTTTTYYCWAYATNAIGTTYGSRVQATTLAVFVPTFVASNPTNQSDKAIYFGASNVYGGNIYANLYLQYLNPNTGSYVDYQTASMSAYGYGTTILNQNSFGQSLCINATNRVYRTHTADYSSSGGLGYNRVSWTSIGTGKSYSGVSTSTNIPNSDIYNQNGGECISQVVPQPAQNPQGKYILTQFNFN